ncbi:MAG: hypothetical protein R2688_03695 [Fimbriimonadaceae bacterium]
MSRTKRISVCANIPADPARLAATLPEGLRSLVVVLPISGSKTDREWRLKLSARSQAGYDSENYVGVVADRAEHNRSAFRRLRKLLVKTTNSRSWTKWMAKSREWHKRSTIALDANPGLLASKSNNLVKSTSHLADNGERATRYATPT